MTFSKIFADEDLLLKLQTDDVMAFEEIYNMFQPALVFFARRLLYSRDLEGAEEIVQDSLMKFYERRKNFDSLPKIRSFLYTVTKNACLQQIRNEATKTKYLQSFMLDFEEGEDLVLNEIIFAEAVRQLREEIEKLPEKCRAVMEKLIWKDMTANEVAEEMKITVSTVNNQKARALSLLKKNLSGAGLIFLLLHL